MDCRPAVRALFVFMMHAPVLMSWGLVPAWADEIKPSPLSLSATVVKGQSKTMVLTLQKPGTPLHMWQATTSAQWLSLAPASDIHQTITTERDTIVVTVKTTGMVLGNNYAFIQIRDIGPTLSHLITVPVTIVVTLPQTSAPLSSLPSGATSTLSSSAPSPSSAASTSQPSNSRTAPSTLVAFPFSLTTTVGQGQRTTLTLHLQKTTGDQHFWQPASSVSWISLSPRYGSLNPIWSDLARLSVAVDTSSLAVGVHAALIYIMETGPGVSKVMSIPVTVTVTAAAKSTPEGAVAPSMERVTVRWFPNNEADLAGYKLYVGTASGQYSQIIDLGNVTSHSLALAKGTTYFFAVSAYDASGHESDRSSELSKSLF